jgi:hypothetical protein
MFPKLLPLILTLACAAGLCAQSAAPPQEPFVAKPADFESWTVTYSYPNGIPRDLDAEMFQKALAENPELKIEGALTHLPPRYPLRRVITLTGSLQREETLYSDQSKEERWIIAGAVVCLDRSEKTLQVGSQTLDMNDPFYFRSFGGFEWLQAQNYQGIQKIAERPCHYFHLDEKARLKELEEKLGKAGPADMPVVRPIKPGETNTMSAWIDVQTKRPLRLVSGDQVMDFQRQAPPAERLKVPAEIARVWMVYAQQELPTD